LGLLAAMILIVLSPAGFRSTALAALAPPGNPDGLYGIGAVVAGSTGQYPYIKEIIPGGAAEKDGRLKTYDQIAAVAQGDAAFVDCSRMELSKVVAMIRGKKGATVRLRIIPGGGDASKPELISLVRSEIKLTPPPAAPGPPDEPEISPGTQAKLDEAVKKIDEITRKQLAANMEKEVAEIVQVTGLDATGKAALENASARAVDKCLRKSVTTIGDNLRDQFRQVPAAQLALVFSQIDNNASLYAQWLQNQSGIWPADQAAWQDALKQTLTPRQAAAWQAAEARRAQAVRQETGNLTQSLAHFVTEQARPAMKQKVSRIQAALDLPADRLAKINAAADSMLDEYGRATAAHAENSLLSMGDEQRKAVLTQRQGFSPWLQPEPKADWDAALAKLLTPEETHRLGTAGDDRKARRAGAMGKMVLALLDEKIAFTAAQREKLEPLLQRLVKGVPELVQDADIDSYFYYSLSTFYAAIAAAPEGDVQAILDPVQWRHWEEILKLPADPDPNLYVENPIRLPAADQDAKPKPIAEPEDLERAISDYLDGKSREERDKVLAMNTLAAEDIDRVAHLSGDAALRLDTAARGSADAFLSGWNVAAENMVRSMIGDATPDTIKARLDSIQTYQLRQLDMGPRQSNHTVWDKTLKAVLTPDQRKAWDQETAARSAYRQKAIAALILAAFDQRTGLSQDQWAKLEPLINQIIAKYSDRFEGYFAYSQNWFLQSFSIFLPIAGIPEKDMKNILTTGQWERWTGSNEFANASQYWANIDQTHRERAKVR
jgi:Spy/CpxP family protein refolding chaperone